MSFAWFRVEALVSVDLHLPTDSPERQAIDDLLARVVRLDPSAEVRIVEARALPDSPPLEAERGEAA